MDKLDKAVVLYYPPREIGASEGAHCGKCMMYTPSGNCTAVAVKPNPANGVCGLYVNGKHMGPDMMGKIPRSVAGYTGTDAPTHCGNCKNYLAGEQARGGCAKVEGTVEYPGCCNQWEKREYVSMLRLALGEKT